MQRHEQETTRIAIDFISMRQAALACVLAGLSVLLAVIGPFDTFGMGAFGWRLLYWGGLVLSSVMLAFFVQAGVLRFVQRPLVVREAVTILVFSLLFTPVVVLWTDILFAQHTDTAVGLGSMFFYVVAICIATSALRYGGVEVLRSIYQEPAAAPRPTPPRLTRRLPDTFAGEVLRLSGDGHYVKISTTEGVFDVRMRLSDAIEEMDTCEGFCVHRSHWITRASIVRSETKKGKTRFILSNGDVVPVGAKYQKELEATGIL